MFGAGHAAAQTLEREAGFEDIARTPLEIFNIDGTDIPPVLARATLDPYAHETLAQCNDIVAEIAAIDHVLGADFDIAMEQRRRLSIGKAAKSVVGSFIPFRGIISQVTGANDRAARVQLAITAGMVRRGYLKGLGQSRDCEYPARPSETRLERVAETDAD